MTHPVHARLQEALKLRGRSMRSLHQQLESEHTHGKSKAGWSYPSVRAYVTGQTVPPLQFLQAAANALRVFEPWLISNYGGPQGVRTWMDQLEQTTSLEEEYRKCDYAVEEEFLAYRSVGEAVRRSLTDLTLWIENLRDARNWGTAMEGIDPSPGEQRTPQLMLNVDLHRMLGKYLREGLVRVGIERHVYLAGAVDVYIAGMCTAMKGAVMAQLTTMGYYEDLGELLELPKEGQEQLELQEEEREPRNG